MQRGQLLGPRLRLAVQARILGDQRDLAGDGAGEIDGRALPPSPAARGESQDTDGLALADDGNDQQVIVHLDRPPAQDRLGVAERRIGGDDTGGPQGDRAALGVERAGRPLRDILERRRQVGRRAQRLGDRQEHRGALGAGELVGVEPRVEDRRRRRHAQRHRAREVLVGEGAPAATEEPEHPERRRLADERHTQERTRLLDLEPAARVGDRVVGEVTQHERARPARDPGEDVVAGRVRDTGHDLAAPEADVSAQDQLGAARLEEPHAGGVGADPDLGQLGEPAHQSPEVERAAQDPRRLGEQAQRGGGRRRGSATPSAWAHRSPARASGARSRRRSGRCR